MVNALAAGTRRKGSRHVTSAGDYWFRRVVTFRGWFLFALTGSVLTRPDVEAKTSRLPLIS